MEAILLGLALAAMITSFISGILGMGGGMILIGVFSWVLPVAVAMVLHGVTQLASNGFRAYMLRQNIHWSILGRYLIGSMLALGLFLVLRITLSRGALFLVLGSLPFLSPIAKALPGFDVTNKFFSALCGFLVTLFQLAAGVSGPILDIFFLRSKLNPLEIVGTKAMTQTIGHALKLIYYGSILGLFTQKTSVPIWAYPLMICMAYLGTFFGKKVLLKLDTKRFRNISTWVLFGIGFVYLYKGFIEIFE